MLSKVGPEGKIFGSRSQRTDLEPNIFPSGPPTQSISTWYYMALSYKDWKLTNSRIWLAQIDIDRGLDFPI